MKGFDEVYNVLLEHSFRYFGPNSTITKQINENNNWNPTISPDQNELIKLVDSNLIENRDSYLNFLYVMNYYIFDNFLFKLKFEIENERNRKINPDDLNFKFDEEELRKVMGNIGFLLLKERTLLSPQRYDYLSLYFQIKKLWSIIITKRYLEDEKFTLVQIKDKIKKGFAIAQLMQVEQAKVKIENFLESFDEIYETRNSIDTHIEEFFREFCLRYFKYIDVGLERFLKDFFNEIIAKKFTTIDLIKANLTSLNTTDTFHTLLTDFLATKDLKTENEMRQFIELIDEKQLNEEFINQPKNPHLDNNLTELKSLQVNPLANSSEDTEITFDQGIDHPGNVSQNYHDITSAFLVSLGESNASNSKESPKKSNKESESDLEDLAASIKIKNLTKDNSNPNALTPEFNNHPLAATESDPDDLGDLAASIKINNLIKSKNPKSSALTPEFNNHPLATTPITTKTTPKSLISNDFDDEYEMFTRDKYFADLGYPYQSSTDSTSQSNLIPTSIKKSSEINKKSKTISNLENEELVDLEGEDGEIIRRKGFKNKNKRDSTKLTNTKAATTSKTNKKRVQGNNNEETIKDQAIKKLRSNVHSVLSSFSLNEIEKIKKSEIVIKMEQSGKIYHDGKMVSIYN